jgi:predicted PurR-regulated permease PerM
MTDTTGGDLNQYLILSNDGIRHLGQCEGLFVLLNANNSFQHHRLHCLTLSHRFPFPLWRMYLLYVNVLEVQENLSPRPAQGGMRKRGIMTDSMKSDKNNSIPFLILFGIVAAIFLFILKPFFYPIFWAVVIASVFMPLYTRIDALLHRPTASASIMIVLIALIIILPATIVGSLLLSQSLQMYNSLSTDGSHVQKNIEHLMDTIAHHPYLSVLPLNKGYWIEKFADIARSIANYIFIHLTALTQNTFVFLVKFAVMLYTLFFFFRDRDAFLRIAMRVIPLGRERDKMLFERFAATARSTLKTTLLIGGLQGTLGGLIFFIAGIEGSLIWGVMMVISAIIPTVGCSIIWAPTGIIMLLTGYIWEGVLILSFGALVISTIDNFLRPILIGKDVKMHPLLIFLSTLGGIVLFGLSGFAIGPIISSLLLVIWEMYDQSYKGEIHLG